MYIHLSCLLSRLRARTLARSPVSEGSGGVDDFATHWYLPWLFRWIYCQHLPPSLHKFIFTLTWLTFTGTFILTSSYLSGAIPLSSHGISTILEHGLRVEVVVISQERAFYQRLFDVPAS